VRIIAIDGKILARAKATLAEKRGQNENRLEDRLQRVYAKVPRVRKLDAEIRATMSELVGVALGANDSAQVDDIRKRNLELQKQRQNEMLGAGFSESYLDDEYMCSKCHDTGYIQSNICECLMNLYKEEQRDSLSNLFKLGNESFDSFKLSYYSDVPGTGKGVSPRRSMEIVYETCEEYARKFNMKSKAKNLLLIGAPGLGKTFLSACIARVVAESGYSVVYNMATSIFAEFEIVKFMRTQDSEEARDEVRRARNEVKRYLECDLLIIDDLGTEMTTSFTIEALYEIINTRLITARKTLVNTNLTLTELRRRYSAQIVSRLEGESHVLIFYGDDIRKKNAL
jgi:DNA replication protein DnaC